jgi:hypothetical protein
MRGSEGKIKAAAMEAAEGLLNRFALNYPAALKGKSYDTMTEEARSNETPGFHA